MSWRYSSSYARGIGDNHFLMHFRDCKLRRMMWHLHLLHAASTWEQQPWFQLLLSGCLSWDLSVVFSQLAGHALANRGRHDVQVLCVLSIRQTLTGRYRLMTDCVHLLDTETCWECHVNVMLNTNSWKSWVRHSSPRAQVGKLECGQINKMPAHQSVMKQLMGQID